MALLSDLHAGGRTLVMVTHDPAVAQWAERTVRLDHGRVREANSSGHEGRPVLSRDSQSAAALREG